jgi:4a-hydroxytetrahydrobiopterin dehydratase
VTGTTCDLAGRKCQPCEKGTPPLRRDEIDDLLRQVPGWQYANGVISRTYRFKDHYETMAFVNAVAWISHREDHHPDLAVGYNQCRVDYRTHTVEGLSENDFICAAKIDKLFDI